MSPRCPLKRGFQPVLRDLSSGFFKKGLSDLCDRQPYEIIPRRLHQKAAARICFFLRFTARWALEIKGLRAGGSIEVSDTTFRLRTASL